MKTVRGEGATPVGRPGNDNEAGAGPRAADPARVAAAIALAGGPATVALPLDPARHLRLRLACAIGHRSAQAILADALDAYLKTVPGIDRLIADAMATGGGPAATTWGSER